MTGPTNRTGNNPFETTLSRYSRDAGARMIGESGSWPKLDEQDLASSGIHPIVRAGELKTLTSGEKAKINERIRRTRLVDDFRTARETVARFMEKYGQDPKKVPDYIQMPLEDAWTEARWTIANPLSLSVDLRKVQPIPSEAIMKAITGISRQKMRTSIPRKEFIELCCRAYAERNNPEPDETDKPDKPASTGGGGSTPWDSRIASISGSIHRIRGIVTTLDAGIGVYNPGAIPVLPGVMAI